MKVLVTGGAGFIGSHMAERLIAEGHEVWVLDNESTGARQNVPPQAHYRKGDVTVAQDVDAVFANQLDAVFHIAGQASTIRSFEDPGADLRTNVHGTITILQHCLRYRVPRLLFASSMTVYGHPPTLPVAEDTPLQPVSYYGISKLAAERYVLATAARTDLDFSFHATAFRMFNVYGARQSLTNPYQGVVAIFMANVLRAEPITIFGDGQQTRDFVHIADVVEAWLAALHNPASYGQALNLGAGMHRSLHELLEAVLTAEGRRRADYPLSWQAARPGDQRHMQADITKARTLLGWQPQLSFAEGIRRTMDWARGMLPPAAGEESKR